ncbi:type II toxin-antitoxin system VapC family toxin [Amycolatopsis alkalitolerans]|uniref:Ribonuclease VapC n=1 Tax=Amycolatopsis alkalitolerans TaxID=2547244 RepID=A0A5C4M584_9PSEU|nr:PIN domain-containing protein [Amycolatopsis alkalitolerans]TNC27814.1 PIN domain-containing protein [Amycolatopsis alkalitolerans]
MIVVDTGPVVALGNARDAAHEQCRALLRTHPGPLLLPEPVLAEIGYVLWRRVGTRAEAAFHRDVARGLYELVSLGKGGAGRVAELVEKYSDLPLGTADAYVITTAERYNASEVATLDRKHFSLVRPRHVQAFTLLP